MDVKFLTLAFSLFALTLFSVPEPTFAPRDYDFLSSGEMKISIPLKPLASGAIEIRSLSDRQRFSDWNRQDHIASYDFLQRFASCTRTPYTVYGKTTPAIRAEMFSWQIIPKPGTMSGLWASSQTYYRTAFGSPTEKNRGLMAKEDWHKNLKSSLQKKPTPPPQETATGEDPFCSSDVIEKQQVWEGKTIRVLRDYSQNRIISGTSHFLIIPKEHRQEFINLTEEEYAETMATANKISAYFEAEFPKVSLHLYHNNGPEASQTVLHWHLHVVAINDDETIPSQDFPCTKSPTNCTRIAAPVEHISQQFNYLVEGCKQYLCLALPRKILSKDELAADVAYWKDEFKQYL